MTKGMSQAFKWCIVVLLAVLVADTYLLRPSLFESLQSSVFGSKEKAEVVITKANLKTLHWAVNLFKLDTGRYPSRERGLIELVQEPADITGWCRGGYLNTTSLPKDGWKNEFLYLLIPQSSKPFVIISFGADGNPGGTGNNADLYSTDIE